MVFLTNTMRKLTDSEIDFIVEDILTALPKKDKRVTDTIINSTIQGIKDDLKAELVNPDIIPELKKELTRQVVGSMIQPGDMVGVTAGQSIGQPVTQCTLSGFHKSGLVNITSTQGIPRISEIFNATHEPKNVNSFIFLNAEVKNLPLENIRLWANNTFKHLTIEDFVDKFWICNCLSGTYEASWYESFEKFYNSKFKNFDWFLRLYLNTSFLWTHRIPMEELARCIEEKYADVFIAWSPEYMGIMDVYIDTTEVDMDCEKEFIREVVKPEIFNCSPSKFSGITDIFVRNNIETKEWVLDSNGSNLSRVLCTPGVDATRTYSNELWEILRVLGIEAVREFIIQEVQGILNAEGTGVGRVHLTILADSMCWRGVLSSISRYGLQKEQAGPLSNASFEQCLDHLLNGAIYGENESTSAVSSGIMCGTVTKIGTGMTDVMYDLGNTYTRSKPIAEEIEEEEAEEDEEGSEHESEDESDRSKNEEEDEDEDMCDYI